MIIIGLAWSVIAALPPTLRFSWDTLPQFFHSQNASGPWSAFAQAVISKYPMATYEKCHGGACSTQSIETRNTAACKATNTATGGATASVYYLNSLIDYGMFTPLYDLIKAHPEYALRDPGGTPIHTLGSSLGYNHSVAAMRDAWIADCIGAIDAGCDACYIDKSNAIGKMGTMSVAQGALYYHAHLKSLSMLNAQLAAKGAWAVSNNQGSIAGGLGTTMTMLEDFAASEHCIAQLQTLASRGLGVQAHAGDLPDGSVNAPGGGDACEEGGVNAMAAFLIGAGNYSYYHCAHKAEWASDPLWPAPGHPDRWLDWLPTYDRPLGAPLALGAKSADGVWRRSFATGTNVTFNATSSVGTIAWSDGHFSRGPPRPRNSNAGTGCVWVTM